MALVEFVELLESKRIDRAKQAEFSLELTHPSRGGRALRELGQRRSFGCLGLDIEIATKGLNGGLEPQPGLGLIEIGAMRPLSGGFERLLGLHPRPPNLVELGGHFAHLVALAAAALAQLGVDLLDLSETRRHPSRETFHRHNRPLEIEATLLGATPSLKVGIETSLGLSDTSSEELLSLAVPGGANLKIATP